MEFNGRHYLSLDDVCQLLTMSRDQVLAGLCAELLVRYRGLALPIDWHEDSTALAVDGLFWIADAEVFSELPFLLGNEPDVERLAVERLRPHYALIQGRLFAGDQRHSPAGDDVLPVTSVMPDLLVLMPSSLMYLWQPTVEQWQRDLGLNRVVEPLALPADVIHAKSKRSTPSGRISRSTQHKIVIHELPETGWVRMQQLCSSKGRPEHQLLDPQTGKYKTIAAIAPSKGITGLAESTLYKMIKEGDFPEPQKQGKASVWRVEVIRQWLEAQQLAKSARAQAKKARLTGRA